MRAAKIHADGSASAPAPTVDAVARARAVEAALNAACWERRDAVRGLLVALVAREHVLLLGPPGCLAGDAEVLVNRGGLGVRMRLDHLVHKFNGGVTGEATNGGRRWRPGITHVQRLGEDGCGRRGRLARALASGVKAVRRIETDSGRAVCATPDHPFLTPHGWARLDELRMGDCVCVVAPPVRGPHQPKILYDQVERVQLHPYAARSRYLHRRAPPRHDRYVEHARVPYHRAVMEAHLSGLDVDVFIERVRSGELDGLVFLDPGAVAVHHKNRDPRDNRIENLEVLSHEDHHRLHGLADSYRHGLWKGREERVVSVVEVTERATYDLAMDDEPHNFTASGFVVHNTAKSMLASLLCGAVGGPLFQLLLTPYTVPEEVFGPYSLRGLERDEYRRVTAGYLPEARIAFLDEAFKANSSILNALLTVLNERAFDNGGRRGAIPLELCVGASNELPREDVLAALYDRFVLRFWVDGLRDRDHQRAMLAASAARRAGAAGAPAVPALAAGDLAALRAAADAVDVSAVLDPLLDLREGLARQHGVVASDRRWVKALALVQAHAALAGRAAATGRDLLVLADALWDRPEQRAAVAQAVALVATTDAAKARQVRDAAEEAVATCAAYTDPKRATADATAALAKLNADLQAMTAELDALDGAEDEVREARERVVELRRGVAAAAMKRLGFTT